MDKITKLFTANPANKELEIKLRLSPDETARFLANFTLVNPKNTVNFIDSMGKDITTIKELSFYGTTQLKDKKRTYTKRSITMPVKLVRDNIQYKLTLSEELSVPEDDMDYKLVRFKRRYSEEFMPNWRIDITFVCKTTSNNINELKRIREKLFNASAQADSFMNDDEIDIEIEFEYTGLSIENKNIEDLFQKIHEYFGKISVSDFYGALEILYKILDHKHKQKTLKTLLVNAVDLTKNLYYSRVFPQITEFFVTEKIDGIRVLLFLENEKMYEMSGEYRYIGEMSIKALTIFEAERVENSYYIYDILSPETKNMTMEERLNFMKKIKLPKNLYLKKFWEIDEEKTVFQKAWKEAQKEAKKNKYEVDGLILTSKHHTYRNTKHYKWKPIQTIDFLVKKCPESLLGIKPYNKHEGKKLYFLFVGISIDDYKKYSLEKIPRYKELFTIKSGYFPIQFCPSGDPLAYLFYSDLELNNKVVELTFDCKIFNEEIHKICQQEIHSRKKQKETLKKEKIIRKKLKENEELSEKESSTDSSDDEKELAQNYWKIVKIREDRENDVLNGNYFGNNYNIAEAIWWGYFDPLTLEELSIPKNIYFKESSKIHRSIRSFNNFAKLQILKKFAKAEAVIDLGGGKGQDIDKYREVGIRSALFIDCNNTSLAEIIQRKQTSRNKHPMEIFIASMDLNKVDAEEIGEFLHRFGILGKHPIVTCQFAIHYFISSTKNAQNFAKIIERILSKDRIFIVSFLNGKKIHDFLIDRPDARWYVPERYEMQLVNKTKKFANGQYMNIRLPFNMNEITKELLVHIETLTTALKKQKIMMETSGSFEEFLPLAKFIELDEFDRQYLKFVDYIIYKKK